MTGERAPRLPGMDPMEIAVADLWATGVAPNGHPTQFLRDELAQAGCGHGGGVVGLRAAAARCWWPASSPTASGR